MILVIKKGAKQMNILIIVLLPAIFIGLGLVISVLSHKVGRFFIGIGYRVALLYGCAIVPVIGTLAVICSCGQ
jgi:hypothetical protein